MRVKTARPPRNSAQIRSRLRSNLTARALSALLRVVPPGDHFLVHGMPSTEGNAVEIARALVDLTDATIVWPEAPPDRYLELVGIPVSRVRRLSSTRSLTSLWSFVRAAAVFHTHGLYGCPTPSGRHPIVNVWHGDSFKLGRHFPDRTLKGPVATYGVSSSVVMGRIKAELSEMPFDRLLLVGNPRTTQMFSPPSRIQLEALGIDSDRPFVMWMPTFRVAQDSVGRIAWSNTKDPRSDRALAKVIAKIAERLNEAGFSLVVKPHMLDATARAVPGALILTNEDLMQQGVPLYSLLGASAGLISDYSSVWIDYLAIDRPIGFLVDDLEDFRDSRGLAEPCLIKDYPGERLDSTEGIEAFVADLHSEGELTKARRSGFKEKIGYIVSRKSGEEIVRATLKLVEPSESVESRLR